MAFRLVAAGADGGLVQSHVEGSRRPRKTATRRDVRRSRAHPPVGTATAEAVAHDGQRPAAMAREAEHIRPSCAAAGDGKGPPLAGGESPEQRSPGFQPRPKTGTEPAGPAAAARLRNCGRRPLATAKAVAHERQQAAAMAGEAEHIRPSGRRRLKPSPTKDSEPRRWQAKPSTSARRAPQRVTAKVPLWPEASRRSTDPPDSSRGQRRGPSRQAPRRLLGFETVGDGRWRRLKPSPTKDSEPRRWQAKPSTSARWDGDG
jgi:hypothetical protein